MSKSKHKDFKTRADEINKLLETNFKLFEHYFRVAEEEILRIMEEQRRLRDATTEKFKNIVFRRKKS